MIQMCNPPAWGMKKKRTAQIQLMLTRECNLKHQVNCILEGPAQHANHREMRRKDVSRGQKNIVFILLFASSESQMGWACNV